MRKFIAVVAFVLAVSPNVFADGGLQKSQDEVVVTSTLEFVR